MKRLLRYVGVLLAALLLLPAVAHAEQVSELLSIVRLAGDGTATVTETIHYDFGGADRHGIYRYLPLETKDANGTIYPSDPHVISVDQDGSPARYTDDDIGTNDVIKIGDPDHTITGVHEYKIVYNLASFAIAGDKGDIVRFNVTGNGWQVPITAATVGIKAPVAALDGLCYTGADGSTDQNCLKRISSGNFEAVGQNLGPGQGMTAEVIYPAHTFSKYLTAGTSARVNNGSTSSGLDLTLPEIVSLVGSFGLLLAAGLLWLWRRADESLRKRRQVVIAEYEAPDGLRPAELGLLADDSANMTEITATLIDLAVRGHLKINQTKPKGWLSKAEYNFIKLESSDALEDYESDLLNTLFVGKPEVLLSQVDKAAMKSTVESIKKKLYDRLAGKGYYTKKSGLLSKSEKADSNVPLYSRGYVFWVFLAVAIGLGIIGGRGVIYIVAISSGIALAALRFNRLTDSGLAEWAKVEGFKLFLSLTETQRLKFTDAPEKTPQLFNKLLPSAVALGVEKQWAKQFEGMDVTSGNNWYYSPSGTFTAYVLASNLGSDFAPAIASGFVPQQSTSGSFGGGFSGGGGGGGGGGSW